MAMSDRVSHLHIPIGYSRRRRMGIYPNMANGLHLYRAFIMSFYLNSPIRAHIQAPTVDCARWQPARREQSGLGALLRAPRNSIQALSKRSTKQLFCSQPTRSTYWAAATPPVAGATAQNLPIAWVHRTFKIKETYRIDWSHFGWFATGESFQVKLQKSTPAVNWSGYHGRRPSLLCGGRAYEGLQAAGRDRRDRSVSPPDGCLVTAVIFHSPAFQQHVVSRWNQ